MTRRIKSPSLPRIAFGSLVLALAIGCAKGDPARVGEACTPEEGCEGTASCVAGTCFHLCRLDSDCLSGTCATLINRDLGEKINACEVARADAAGSSGSSSSNSSDTCYDAPLCSGGMVVRSCITPSRSCYYLVGATKVPCATGCNCQAAAERIVSSACKYR